MVDALTPVLSQLAVRGSVFSRARLHAPWGVRTRGTPTAIFHVVVRGSGFARAEDADGRPLGSPVAFRSGDLLLFPHGDGHVLTDHPHGPAQPIRTLAGEPGPDGLGCIATGGQGALTSLICGTLEFDSQAADMVLPHLPRLIHVPADQGPTAAWMDATMRMLGSELDAAQPGGDVVVARLAELLFIQAVRAWARSAPDGGWLSALADPGLGRAMAAMHAEPRHAWTVGDLARTAGMSRSAFAARFADRVGEAPAAHLTRWRMLLARRQLATSDAGLAQVAEQVGYGSQAAFIRAFKREVGTTPAQWRRQQAA